MEAILIACLVNGELITFTQTYNFEMLRAEITEPYNERYGGSNWLPMPVSDLPADFSVDTYTIVEGELVPAPAEVIAERQAARQTQANQAEISELRTYLTSTDYAAIKCGELGLSMAAEYPDLHAQRTEARARINALQEGGAE